MDVANVTPIRRKASNSQKTSINDYTSLDGFKNNSMTVHHISEIKQACMSKDIGMNFPGKLRLVRFNPF